MATWAGCDSGRAVWGQFDRLYSGVCVCVPPFWSGSKPEFSGKRRGRVSPKSRPKKLPEVPYVSILLNVYPFSPSVLYCQKDKQSVMSQNRSWLFWLPIWDGFDFEFSYTPRLVLVYLVQISLFLVCYDLHVTPINIYLEAPVVIVETETRSVPTQTITQRGEGTD